MFLQILNILGYKPERLEKVWIGGKLAASHAARDPQQYHGQTINIVVTNQDSAKQPQKDRLTQP